MNLLIDIGNSRIKWAQQRATALTPMAAAAYEPAQMDHWCKRHWTDLDPPRAVLVSNVAGPAVATALTGWCSRQWHLQPWFARTEARAGDLVNGYREVAQLGVDRWLALVAVRQLSTGPACVISCGTAMTFDAIDATGEHLGGWIAPGPELMQAALNTATLGARSKERWTAAAGPGRSTAEAVAAGSTQACAGWIERLAKAMQIRFDDRAECFITGGAATAVLPYCSLSMRYIEDLVLQGLAWYAVEKP